MMVIYLPVKFEFDWTQHFQVQESGVMPDSVCLPYSVSPL